MKVEERLLKKVLKNNKDEVVFLELGVLNENVSRGGVYSKEDLAGIAPTISKCTLKEQKVVLREMVKLLKEELEKEHTYLQTLRILIALDALEIYKVPTKSKKVKFCKRFLEHTWDARSQGNQLILGDMILLDNQ